MNEKKTLRVKTSFVLYLAPYICLLILFIPISTGFLGTLLPALGYFPALGEKTISFQYFRDFFAVASIGKSIFSSLYIGIISTFLSFFLAFFTVAIFYDHAWLKNIRKGCIPLISLPHAALAIALTFLIIPSGFLARIFSPWLTGWERPQDLLIAQDTWGISMIVTLVIKETPFLIIILISALSQIKVTQILLAFRSMGYQKWSIWLKCILPQIYQSLKLPIYAILVFSISVVDIAIIIGPQIPFPLAARILEWFNHPADLNFKLSAAAGSLWLLLLCIFAICLWEIVVKIIAVIFRPMLSNGNRGYAWRKTNFVFKISLITTYGLTLLSLAGLFIWSFAKSWRFPNLLPTSWTTTNWEFDLTTLWELFYNSLFLGFFSALISIILVILCLEREKRFFKTLTSKGLFLIYIPLLIPQISTMFGFQIFIARINYEGKLLVVLWSHLIFVLPYVFLSIGDTYRSFDQRYENIALGLGVSKWKFFWKVKFMLLLEPILFVFTIGFSVSISLYIPTVFVGAGRINTITTEAVNLFSGANRKTIGVYTTLQMLLPFVFFTAANFLKSLPFYWKQIYYFLYLSKFNRTNFFLKYKNIN